MKAGALYRHLSCIDMDMHVTRVVASIEDWLFLEVKWWNRHYKFYQPDVFTTDLVGVRREDLWKWSEVK